MAIVVVTASIAISQHFGQKSLFQGLSVFLLFSLWLQIRFLRVNDSKHSVALIGVLSFQLLACILIGFFDFHFVTFIGAMLLVNLLLYWARGSRPARMDYNLFLRAATDGLSTAEHDIKEKKEFSRSQLEQFAKFLGRQWLIRDYRISDERLRLFLPPASLSMFQTLLPPGFHSSQVLVYGDGTCKASLAPREAKSIRTLTRGEIDPDRLSSNVQSALANSLRQFTSGDLASATETLCQVDDSQVFKKTPSKTKTVRWVFAISIGACLLSIAMFGVSLLIM